MLILLFGTNPSFCLFLCLWVILVWRCATRNICCNLGVAGKRLFLLSKYGHRHRQWLNTIYLGLWFCHMLTKILRSLLREPIIQLLFSVLWLLKLQFPGVARHMKDSCFFPPSHGVWIVFFLSPGKAPSGGSLFTWLHTASSVSLQGDW